MASERAFSETSMASAIAHNPIEGDDDYNGGEQHFTPSVRQSRTVPQDSTLSEPDPDVPLTRYERIYNRYVLLFFVCVTNFFLFFDRGALTSMITDIRADKEIAGGDHKTLSETQGSLVVSAYMIGFVLSGPICSAAGRFINARYIMAAGLSIVIAMGFMTAFASSFPMLLVVRCINGVGEAAISPYFMTMVDNCASPRTRTMWIGVYLLAIPLGMALGTAVSGYLASNASMIGGRASWRLPFFLNAICLTPAAFCSMLYPSRFSPTAIGVKAEHLVSVQRQQQQQQTAPPTLPQQDNVDNQPLLGDSNNAASTATNTNSKFDHATPLDAIKRLATNKLYACLVLGMGGFILVASGNTILTQPMLRFGPWKLSQTEASTLSALVAVPSVIGSVVGGIVLDKFGGSAGRRGLFRCCRHMAMMTYFAIPIIVASLYVYSVWGYAAMQIIGMMAIMTVIAPSSAAILSSVDRDVRTYAMSYATIFERLMALPGPTIIGMMADEFSDGCHAYTFQELCESGGADHHHHPTITNATTTFMTSTATATTTNVPSLMVSAEETISLIANGIASLMDNVTTTIDNITTTAGPITSTTSAPANAALSENCVWVPGKAGSNGSCMNEYEGRDATAFFAVLYALPMFFWTLASVIAYRKSLKNMAAAAAAAAAAAEEGKATATIQ